MTAFPTTRSVFFLTMLTVGLGSLFRNLLRIGMRSVRKLMEFSIILTSLFVINTFNAIMVELLSSPAPTPLSST